MVRAIVLKVTVGEAFEITTAGLPRAMELCSYRMSLSAKNGAAPYSWSISDGSLPAGLRLRENGMIEGKPVGIGEKTFTVTATDSDGRTAVKAFTFTVEENAWSQTGKDAGHAGYNPVPTTATDTAVWRSETLIGANAVLSGAQRVFVLTDGGVTGLDIKNGRTVYRYEGSYDSWAYAAGSLYLLSGDGTFVALNAGYGRERWVREGVEAFATDGQTLYLSTEEGTVLVTAASDEQLDAGTTLSTIPARFGEEDKVLFRGDRLIKLAGSTLSTLAKKDGRDSMFIPGRSADAVSDETGFVALDEYGRIFNFDSELTFLSSFDTGAADGELLVLPERIVVYGEYGVKVFDRTTFLLESSSPFFASAAAPLSQEKLLAAGEAGLSSLNLYRGTPIWQASGAYRDVIVASERVFALHETGEVRCYAGTSNFAPPETAITLSPASPDGDAGWYVTQPELESSGNQC